MKSTIPTTMHTLYDIHITKSTLFKEKYETL
jgi:hypothetical protein